MKNYTGMYVYTNIHKICIYLKTIWKLKLMGSNRENEFVF